MWLTPLACAGVCRFRNSTPSNPEGPQVSEDAKEAFRATIPAYRCAGQLLVLVTGPGSVGTFETNLRQETELMLGACGI